MKKVLIALGTVALLAGCAGRDEPQGSFLDPVCMPDGSVVFRQLPDDKDQFGQPRAKKEYCRWNQTKQQ